MVTSGPPSAIPAGLRKWGDSALEEGHLREKVVGFFEPLALAERTVELTSVCLCSFGLSPDLFNSSAFENPKPCVLSLDTGIGGSDRHAVPGLGTLRARAQTAGVRTPSQALVWREARAVGSDFASAPPCTPVNVGESDLSSWNLSFFTKVALALTWRGKKQVRHSADPRHSVSDSREVSIVIQRKIKICKEVLESVTIRGPPHVFCSDFS